MAAIAAGTLVLASSSFASIAVAEQVPVTVQIGEPPAPGAPPPQEPSAPAPEPPVSRPPAPEAPAPGPDPDPDPGQAPPVVEETPPAGEAAPPAGAPDPAPEPPEQTARPGPLPRTGSDALRLVRDAAAAIAVGLLLVLAARKELP